VDGDRDGRNVTKAGFVLIVSRPLAPYIAAMREALAKLLLIAAILLMPFGMGAPAAAASHHAPAATSAMRHCPDQAPASGHQGGVSECTMGCAASLPAISDPADQLLLAIAAPGPGAPAERLTGLHPETVTPPPRLV